MGWEWFWGCHKAVLPVDMIAMGRRIAVADHARAAIQPATVQPAAKFKKPIHGQRW